MPALRHRWLVENFVGPVFTLLFITSPFWILAAAFWLELYWEDVVEWFKVRLTYPRTGYVTPPSYWDEAEPQKPQQQHSLLRLLSILGSFWVWCYVSIFLSFTPWPASRGQSLVMLGILLVIRGLRFGLYPSARDPNVKTATAWSRIGAFFGSVFNSFWVWLFLSRVLPPPSSALRPLVDSCVLLVASLFVALLFLRKLGNFEAICGCVCGVVCAFLVFRNSSASIALAWLAPGLCAAFIGATRLYRTLRANPARSI